jgi:hypothetical protein
MTQDYHRLNEEIIINHYVWNKFKEYRSEITLKYRIDGKDVVPFIPVSDTVASTFPWGDNSYIVYDSYYTNRTSYRQFYPIKTGQMIYSIKGTIQEIFDWRDFIVNILDRGDQSGQDINNPGLIDFLPPDLRSQVKTHFHCTNVFQVNSINQSTKQSGVEKDFSTDLIIKYDYHISNLFGEVNPENT